MNYHESYWVVVGTAVPVVLLAVVLALTDVIRKGREKRGWNGWLSIVAAYINDFLLIILLLTSLSSLAHENDAMPLTASTYLLAATLILVGFQTTVAVGRRGDKDADSG